MVCGDGGMGDWFGWEVRYMVGGAGASAACGGERERKGRGGRSSFVLGPPHSGLRESQSI